MNLQKQKPFRSKEYLAYVRSLPCTVRGCYNKSYAHHTKNGGMRLKGPDTFAIPLCLDHHTEHDAKGKTTFYEDHFLDRWEVVARTLAKYVEGNK